MYRGCGSNVVSGYFPGSAADPPQGLQSGF